MISNAQLQDAKDIQELWNHYVRHSTATFRSEPYGLREIERMIEELQAQDFAFLVARNEALLGFALYKQFRGGDGYARTMEHSIYLAQSSRGRGIGRALMEALETHAKRRNVHSFIAGVTADNQESVQFHERLGFRHTGRISEVAFKFDQPQAIAFMQKLLHD